MKKFCPNCKILKSKTDFHRRRDRPVGLVHECKGCVSKSSKIERLKNLDWARKRTREYARKWRAKNPKHVVAYRKKYRKVNLERLREQMQKGRLKWKLKNPDHYEKSGRWYSMMRNYGLTKEKYVAMLAAQKGRCAICKRKPERLWVDHCHKTGLVRGLICNICNLGLGAFQDSLAGVRAATAYLEKFSAGTTPVES